MSDKITQSINCQRCYEIVLRIGPGRTHHNFSVHESKLAAYKYGFELIKKHYQGKGTVGFARELTTEETKLFLSGKINEKTELRSTP